MRTAVQRSITLGDLHKEFLHVEWPAIGRAPRPLITVFPAGRKNARLLRIREIRQQDVGTDSLAQCRILQSENYFHAFVQIARHTISAAQVHLGIPAVAERKNPAVLEEAP